MMIYTTLLGNSEKKSLTTALRIFLHEWNCNEPFTIKWRKINKMNILFVGKRHGHQIKMIRDFLEIIIQKIFALSSRKGMDFPSGKVSEFDRKLGKYLSASFSGNKLIGVFNIK